MSLATNKQALFDYEILDTYEAGLVLVGGEVKSAKAGQINLKGSYITVKHGIKPELNLINAQITKYAPAGPQPDYDPKRARTLLLHKKELKSLIGKLSIKGLTLIPLRVYTKGNLIKVEIALGRGKKKFDKKASLKKKDLDRELDRMIKVRG